MTDSTISKLGQLTPEALQQLAAVDVMSKPTPEPDPEETKVAERLKELQKSATFTIKLTGPQLAQVIREADQKNLSWKEHLTQRINAEIFGGLVGRSVITAPSFASGARVVAPTGGLVSRG